MNCNTNLTYLNVVIKRMDAQKRARKQFTHDTTLDVMNDILGAIAENTEAELECREELDREIYNPYMEAQACLANEMREDL